MEWTRGPFLGRGSYATVFAATSTSGDTFAVKSVDYSQSENLIKEQHFLSILKSPYVVSYKGCDTTREDDNKLMCNLFMDYMACGSIIDLLKAGNGGGFNSLEIASYTRQIVEGLEYIHSCGIVHCDIKGANILVDRNGVKIGDLGCAKWANEVSQIRGTPMFMAPEVSRGEEQGFPADIWALGCTIIEMMRGDSPWSNISDPVSLLYRIAYSSEIPEFPDELCDQARDFLSKCLVRDPKQRWTAKQLLNHPYIQRFDDDSNQIGCEKFVTSSPTSILDQDVWDSMDESSSSSSSSSSLVSSTNFSESRCASSILRQRIKNLASKSGMIPKRAYEKEDNQWITIRRMDQVIGVVGDDEMEVDLHLDQWR